MESKRVEEIYKEIEGYSIELDEDPSTKGQRYIQEKVAKCRNYLNSISRILLEIRKEHREVAHQLRGEKAQFEIEFETILATNEQIKRLAHIEERRATINVILAHRRKTISDLEMQLDDLKVIEKVVGHRHDELKGTNQDIKAQARTMRDELDTGAFYGVDLTNSNSKPGARVMRDIDEKELEDILSGKIQYGPTSLTTLEIEVKVQPEKAIESITLESPITVEPALTTNSDSIDDLVNEVANLVPPTTSVLIPSLVAEDPEIEAFLKSDLPSTPPVSNVGKPAERVTSGTTSDEDFTDIFATL